MAEFVTGFQTPEGIKKYDYLHLGNKPDSFSSALKGSARGAVVRVDDVSPIIHEVGCKVKSKNLYDNSSDYVKAPETEWSYEDGTLNVAYHYLNKYIALEEGKTYTFSYNSTRTGGAGGGVYLRAYATDKQHYAPLGGNTYVESASVTFTIPKGFPIFRITFYGDTAASTYSATYTEIMLEEGTKATGYVPYVNPGIATVKRCGKNLIPHPYINQGASANGGTITVQANGGIAFSGTPTAYVGVSIYNGPALATSGTVTFSVGGSTRNVVGILFMYDANGDTVATKSTTSVMEINLDTFPTVTNWNITFSRAISNESMSGVAYPQIEVGSVQTEHELFKESEIYTPSEDGTLEGVYSISPTMTFMTDTENIMIEVEYQRDLDKAIKEIEQILSPARIVYVNILASAWKGSNSLYSQVVTVPGATKNSQVDLTPSIEQLVIFYNKNLTFVTENVNGVVTVYAIGQKPENDYTIQATVTEVNR